mgnify:CR=1 FL=1|tara:strand:+ start:763 stop:1047 length:285 start_codon:yes stop_codon:yes gene_type:complete
MRSEELNEDNGWKADFFESNGELFESYLFADGEDSLDAAREFCRQMSPKDRTQLVSVNSKRIVVCAAYSKEYVVVRPPEKMKKNIKMNQGDENA